MESIEESTWMKFPRKSASAAFVLPTRSFPTLVVFCVYRNNLCAKIEPWPPSPPLADTLKAIKFNKTTTQDKEVSILYWYLRLLGYFRPNNGNFRGYFVSLWGLWRDMKLSRVNANLLCVGNIAFGCFSSTSKVVFYIKNNIRNVQDDKERLETKRNRGYYTVARRYDIRAQRVSKILFLPLENKIHIFKPPCNVLFII